MRCVTVPSKTRGPHGRRTVSEDRGIEGEEVLDLKGNRGHVPPRSGGRGDRPDPPLEVGQRVRDLEAHREGTIVDLACQYAHPKADPVYNYLVRWDDGQVQAFLESAFDGVHGLEAID